MTLFARLKCRVSALCVHVACVTGLTVLTVSDAHARVVETLPEPSVLSLSGIAVVAGIVAYRLKNRK